MGGPGPFLPGSTPGMPLMIAQPRAAQAFQQASELVAEAVGEPSLRVDPADPDPAGTFAARVRQLPPAKRQALAAFMLQLLLTANLLVRSGAVMTAGQLVALALALYAVLARAEE
jgi:hypothetical protein